MSIDHSIRELVRGAFVSGDLSRESVEALGSSEVAGLLSGGLGLHSVSDGEVLLVTVLVDDSTSIQHVMPAIRTGHNRLIEMLGDTPGSERVFVSTRYLNGRIVNAFVPARQATLLNGENYASSRLGKTPLYYQSVLTLGTVIAKTEAFQQADCQVRTITLIITDGEEDSGYNVPASHVAWLARDMQRSGNHLVAAYAVGRGSNLQEVFTTMGVERKWILTSPDALTSLLTFAKAAVQASLGQESFQLLLNGPGFNSV